MRHRSKTEDGRREERGSRENRERREGDERERDPVHTCVSDSVWNSEVYAFSTVKEHECESGH